MKGSVSRVRSTAMTPPRDSSLALAGRVRELPARGLPSSPAVASSVAQLTSCEATTRLGPAIERPGQGMLCNHVTNSSIEDTAYSPGSGVLEQFPGCTSGKNGTQSTPMTSLAAEKS